MIPMVELLKRVRKMPLVRQEIPLEWCLSHPLPVRGPSGLTWRFFFFPMPAIKDGPRPIGQPRASLTVSENGDRVVQFTRGALLAGEPFPEKAPIGRREVRTKEAREEARKHEGEFHDAVGRLAAQDWAQPPEEGAASIVQAARQTVLDAPLLRYYDAVAPEFWEWVGSSRRT